MKIVLGVNRKEVGCVFIGWARVLDWYRGSVYGIFKPFYGLCVGRMKAQGEGEDEKGGGSRCIPKEKRTKGENFRSKEETPEILGWDIFLWYRASCFCVVDAYRWTLRAGLRRGRAGIFPST